MPIDSRNVHDFRGVTNVRFVHRSAFNPDESVLIFDDEADAFGKRETVAIHMPRTTTYALFETLQSVFEPPGLPSD